MNTEPTPTTTEVENTPVSNLVKGPTDEYIANSMGISRDQARRTCDALLSVINATLPTGTNTNQAINAAINILGMTVSDIIAGNLKAEDRGEFVENFNAFIADNVTEMGTAYDALQAQKEAAIGALVQAGRDAAGVKANN